MSHLIRLRFLQRASPPIDTAIGEGLFQGISPQRFSGRPCRALEALAVLSGDDEAIERHAAFLRKNALQDPERLIFMDCSLGEPFGSLDPFPECADWIHDERTRRWHGACRSPDGPIEAPLFAFWLLQALAAIAKIHDAAPPSERYMENGRKAPVAARPDLLWSWDESSEPRLELLCAGHALALSPQDPGALAAVGTLSHPSLALEFARIPPERYERLCGSSAALASLLSRNELDRCVSQAAGRAGRAARL